MDERGWRTPSVCVYMFSSQNLGHDMMPFAFMVGIGGLGITRVLLLCFVLCTITYSSMAVVGYFMYGSNVRSEITLNLPTGSSSSKVAIWTIVVIPIAKFAILMTPVFDTIEERFSSSHRKKTLSFLLRTTLMISSVIIAMTFPFFTHLMSLVGALFNVTASIILPCLCYLKISGTYKNMGFESITIGCIVIVGVVVAVMGVGILSIPYARCLNADAAIRSYPDIGERAFGKTGRTIVLIAMNLELYLVATCFLILEGDCLSNLLPDVGIHLYGIHIGGRKIFIVIIVAIILPTIFFNNMKVISYVSATGVLASLIVLGSVLWVGQFGGVGFKETGKLVIWKGMPRAISLYTFCYAAHPVFPTLFNSMRNRRQFKKVLLLCFVLCTITYSSMAVVGYFMYGSNVRSEITLNLPTGSSSSKVAIWTIVVIQIAKFAILMTPVFDTIEERFSSSHRKKTLSFLLRTTLIKLLVR